MSNSVDQAFIKKFEEEVKLAYQRMGSKLVSTVRTKMNIGAKDTTFQKVGKGAAGVKSRHGLVPLMNLDHTNVTCTLADYYAADYIDKLDELKTNIDERQVVAQSGAAAMGRKSDELLNTVLAAATTVNAVVATGAAGMTQAKIITAMENLSVADVPDDGERYLCIDPRHWTDLLSITAFASSDYISADDLPFKGGMVARRWLGFFIFTFTGLSNGAGGSTERRAYAYHKTAAGFASGAEVSSEINYIPERAANLVTHSMSQGAVEIDGYGIQCIDALI